MELTMKFSLLCTSLPSEEQANKLAREIINQQLAFCCWIRPAHTAMYRWNGEEQEDKEYELICKTLPTMIQSLTSFIQSQHPFEAPYIGVFSGDIMDLRYSAWVEETLFKG